MHTRPDVARITGGKELGDIVYSEQVIQQRVRELGAEVGEYYQGGELLLIGLLKGSIVFMSDLVRWIPRPHVWDFLIAASYGSATKSSGHVRLLYDPATDVAGKHVLLVEDIVDSGATLDKVVRIFETREPASLEICTLLHKRLGRTVLEPRFVGFDAPAKFLVGYGLDFDEEFRHLPFIASLKE
ncbi:MAG: hypoxanthine phosphoribosyltransferase [Gemmatimonas sp. SG8_17]|nr:MAG: hypoxanthine phosphoribosyltransferase [Gemmatimonas sp. SG8_17]